MADCDDLEIAAEVLDVANAVAQDVIELLSGDGDFSADPRLAAYQRSLDLALSLRAMLDDAESGPSLAALVARRESDLLASSRQLGRLRAAARMALKQPLSPGVKAALEMALE